MKKPTVSRRVTLEGFALFGEGRESDYVVTIHLDSRLIGIRRLRTRKEYTLPLKDVLRIAVKAEAAGKGKK